eukprot:Tbor_TRINITY_DN2398_c0_g1::TRINITY_DN2398_c0_g1_i1::g.132::m.132
MALNTMSVFMTPADFEAVKHDPMLVIERASQFIALLEQQDAALSEENYFIKHQLEQGNLSLTFTPEQHTTLMETAAELTMDHQELSQKYVDMETVNIMMQGVVEAIRNDKAALSEELVLMKDQQKELVNHYNKMVKELRDLEDEREMKEDRLKTYQEEINNKIAELERYTTENMQKTQKTIDLQDATEKIGSGRLALEAETTALEQATQQQERTITYLQNEITNLNNTIKAKGNEMVQLKKHMSASILELQLQITKAEEEMSRIRTSVANEKDLTGRQNLWLAKDLQSKTQELLMTRQELAKENSMFKSELSNLRDKSARLKSNVLVVEKRNQILHGDLKRLETEDDAVKEAYVYRKDNAFDEMNRQAVVVSQLNADLQTAREDLYMIKSKLCKHCRSSIIQPNVVNDPNQLTIK